MAKRATPQASSLEDLEHAVELALRNLGKAFASVPTEEKPRNITELVKIYPDDGKTIQQGKRAKLLDVKLLSTLGIIKPTTAVLKHEGIRRIDIDELRSDFEKMVGDWVVLPGDGKTEFFPYDVCGLDVANAVELREMLVAATCEAPTSLKPGDAIPIEHSTGYGDRGTYPCVKICIPKECFFEVSDDKPFYESSLIKKEGASVIASSFFDSKELVQISVRYVAPLRAGTLAYILRTMGVVTENDVLGDMSWRFRMCQKALGDFSILKHFESLYANKL